MNPSDERRGGRPSLRRGPFLVATLALAVLGLIACSAAPSVKPTSSPVASPDSSPSPAGSPVAGGIEHATGATDVVFRFEEGGGFVAMGFFATETPIFTLYGDGTVIFRDATAGPPAERDGIIRMTAFQTVKLTEDEIQGFLQYAVVEGGLGVARATYGGVGADLPTAIFTINAAGQSRTVSVMALGMERDPGPDTLVLRALAGLGDKVRSFGPEVEDERTWAPDRWRGVLTADASNPPRDWPWPEILPADFIQHAEPGAPQFPIRTMTPVEIDALGLDEIEGGFSGLSLSGPNGRTYLFALRPLFPDEAY